MQHHDAEMTDVIIVLEDLNDEQTFAVARQLEVAGLSVRSIDHVQSVIEGSIQTQMVHGLSKVTCVRTVRSVMSYTVDFPPGDPRDRDGVEDTCDESED